MRRRWGRGGGRRGARRPVVVFSDPRVLICCACTAAARQAPARRPVGEQLPVARPPPHHTTHARTNAAYPYPSKTCCAKWGLPPAPKLLVCNCNGKPKKGDLQVSRRIRSSPLHQTNPPDSCSVCFAWSFLVVRCQILF